MKKGLLTWALVLLTSLGFGQEICDNAIDDDADGLIDLNDPDCDCNYLIDFSLIPNPSFEDTLCCPTGESMLFCADSWIQASDGTSDFYSFCDFDSLTFPDAMAPEEPLPGGGESFIGLYNFLGAYREYAGVCTTGPLMAGTNYSINLHTAYAFGDEDELDLQLYGTPNCVELPWSGVTCPEGIDNWTLLASEIVAYEMDGSWVSVTLSFTPFSNINAIAIGGPCGDIGETDGSYFYFDELILVETETMGYIEETGGWCSEDLILTAETVDLGGTWQWYKDGIALIGETASTLEPFLYGEGVFTAVYSFVGGCKTMEYESPGIPTADFDFENVCFGETTVFENLSTITEGEIEDWMWTFGDAETSNLTNPTHFYTVPGTYIVELVAYSDDPSCNDTASAEVAVFAKPEPDFDINGVGASYAGDWIACARQPYEFIDLTTIVGPVSFASWNWDFGNGDSSDEQNPDYLYSDGGTYEITLTVVSENGCVDSVKQTIVLTEIEADFSMDSVCENLPITFVNNSSTSDGSTLTYLWDFGDDSDTSYLENPSHLYVDGGNYDTKLVVENAQGCIDSVVKNVFVFPKPEPNFYADYNPTDYFNTDLELIMIYPDPNSTYYWEMPGGIPENSTEYGSTRVVYPEFVRGDYEVFLTEVNEYGCSDSFSIVIQVMEDQMIYAPNAFTPNGDPFNQNWGVYVEGYNLDEFYLDVFNRWGELVWSTQDPNARWDGTYAGSVLVPDGVYIWKVTARDQINDEIFEHFGFITVLK